MEEHAASAGRRAAVILILLAGAGLRLWQFLGNTSFWTDEIALAGNIVGRPAAELLFTPLDDDQVAPPGFLLVEKSAAMLFGASERALRLFPLVCGLVSLWLFYRLAQRVLAGWTLVLGLGLFALGVPLILYSAELKQYSGDVAFSLLLTSMAFDLRRGEAASRGAFLRTGLIGLVIVWFSQSAVLVMAGLGLALVALAFARKDHSSWRNLAVVLPLWAAGAAGSILAGRASMTPAMRDFLYRFWSHGFWPLPPRDPADVLWLPRNLRGFWGQSLFQYPASVLYLALMLVGFWAMWRRRRDAALLLLGPVAAMLAASAAGLYPFTGRLLLPLAPAFLLAASEGGGFLAARLPARRLVVAGLLTLQPLAALIENFPVQAHEETRPMLAYLAQHRLPGDRIYVYHGAAPAFRYYGPRFGLDRSDVLLGGCHRGDPRAYLLEIDGLRGRPRVWAIFAHDVPRLGEQAVILAYLSRIGVRKAGILVPDKKSSAVTAELYDLAVVERLAAASAETFPVPPGNPDLARRLGCGSGASEPTGASEP